MNSTGTSLLWKDIVVFPLGKRSQKPRSSGMTMIIDKGLGLGETRDLVQVAADYIDFIKLGFGTSALYPNNLLGEKIDLVKSYGVDIYPGGTFLEVACLQDKDLQFLKLAKDMGFTCIEVSDGTINLETEKRERLIKQACNIGFKVLTEVGKKEEGLVPCIGEMAEQVEKDLRNGAFKVILEGRESGINVGLYDSKGKLVRQYLEKLVQDISDPGQVIWEAPRKDQQLDFISRFGVEVNLGNIPAGEILAVEALRTGLRADSLKIALAGQLV